MKKNVSLTMGPGVRIDTNRLRPTETPDTDDPDRRRAGTTTA